MKEYICKYCRRVCKNENSLRNHERLCKQNPERQIIQSNFIKYNEMIKNGIRKPSNQFIKAKELGVKIQVSKETRLKIGLKSKQRKHTNEAKIKISKSMKKAVLEHPESYSSNEVCGRVKRYLYNGIYLTGKWELEVAKFLDKENIKWKRPNNGFQYYWNNGYHQYFPDFYLPDYDKYIEVKGYERERDKCKYKSIEEKLIVLRLKEINQIKEGTFNLGL